MCKREPNSHRQGESGGTEKRDRGFEEGWVYEKSAVEGGGMVGQRKGIECARKEGPALCSPGCTRQMSVFFMVPCNVQ